MVEPDTKSPIKKILGWSIVSLIVILRIAAIFFIPYGQKVEHHLEGLNDEPAHYNYIKYLAEHRSFPVLEHWVLEKDAFERNEFEYYQPPVYYLLCMPLYRLAGPKAGLIACRLFSALIGLMTLFVMSLFLKDLGYDRMVRLAAVIFFGLLPSHFYFCSLVSNDGLSWLLALMLTRELLRYGRAGGNAHPGSSLRSIILIAVILSAGMLTKSSLMLFYPVVAGVFGYRFLVARERAALVHGAAVFGLSIAAVLPWYVRNLVVYHSLLGTPKSAFVLPLSFSTFAGFIKGSIKYFWFPMQDLGAGTPAFQTLCLIGSAVVAVHLVLAIAWQWKRGRPEFVPVMLLVLLLLNAAAYLWYYMQWQNPEARFLFPALASVAFFMLIPISGVGKKLKAEFLFVPYFAAIALFPYVFLPFAK